MKFLADESIERGLIAALREVGHDIVSVFEVAPGSDDDTVLALANRDERILITNDKDFGTLVYRGRQVSAGILLIRLGHERTAEKLVAVRRLLAEHIDLLPGHFTVLGALHIRRRPLLRAV